MDGKMNGRMNERMNGWNENGIQARPSDENRASLLRHIIILFSSLLFSSLLLFSEIWHLVMEVPVTAQVDDDIHASSSSVASLSSSLSSLSPYLPCSRSFYRFPFLPLSGQMSGIWWWRCLSLLKLMMTFMRMLPHRLPHSHLHFSHHPRDPLVLLLLRQWCLLLLSSFFLHITPNSNPHQTLFLLLLLPPPPPPPPPPHHHHHHHHHHHLPLLRLLLRRLHLPLSLLVHLPPFPHLLLFFGVSIMSNPSVLFIRASVAARAPARAAVPPMANRKTAEIPPFLFAPALPRRRQHRHLTYSIRTGLSCSRPPSFHLPPPHPVYLLLLPPPVHRHHHFVVHHLLPLCVYLADWSSLQTSRLCSGKRQWMRWAWMDGKREGRKKQQSKQTNKRKEEFFPPAHGWREKEINHWHIFFDEALSSPSRSSGLWIWFYFSFQHFRLTLPIL